jgi:hypothetical protein
VCEKGKRDRTKTALSTLGGHAHDALVPGESASYHHEHIQATIVGLAAGVPTSKSSFLDGTYLRYYAERARRTLPSMRRGPGTKGEL